MKVLIFGELCQDKFIYGSSKRLSPEAPVPVFVPERVETNLGMAGNVMENIKSISDSEIILYSQKESITKTRYVDDKSNHMFLRVDEGEESITPFELTDEIIQNIKESDIVIVSDYDKGFLDEEDIQWICEHNTNVFIDTKKILDEWCINASFIKINHVEYERTEYTLKHLNIEDKLVVTLSNKGCQYKGKLFPVEKD